MQGLKLGRGGVQGGGGLSEEEGSLLKGGKMDKVSTEAGLRDRKGRKCARRKEDHDEGTDGGGEGDKTRYRQRHYQYIPMCVVSATRP